MKIKCKLLPELALASLQRNLSLQTVHNTEQEENYLKIEPVGETYKGREVSRNQVIMMLY